MQMWISSYSRRMLRKWSKRHNFDEWIDKQIYVKYYKFIYMIKLILCARGIQLELKFIKQVYKQQLNVFTKKPKPKFEKPNELLKLKNSSNDKKAVQSTKQRILKRSIQKIISIKWSKCLSIKFN